MIEQIFENLNLISIVVAICILLVPFILRFYFGKSHVAGIVLTLGILGTFSGVFIGLLQFDEANIETSVPMLIAGLQTAFVTSIAGMLANLILRITPRLYGFPSETKGVKSDDIGEQLVNSMNRISESIAGDGETTMVSQLQRLRTVNMDGFSDMKQSFEQFAEKVVADNTQSLIDALTDVMKDFNTQINEQFGDNFKQLNEGVGAMLVWQQEYKEHVEKSSTILDKVFEGIDKVSKNLEGIDTSMSQTASAHEEIYKTNDVLKLLITDFNGQVQSFATIGENAKQAFPIIEQRMDELTKAADQFIRQSTEHLQTSYNQFTQAQKDSIDQHRGQIDKMITDNHERINTLDTELGNELNRALESLGSHLTSLSRQFAEDYSPLTEKLNRVLDISRNTN